MAYRIVVDAGHGGDDPGAVNGNIYEKNFNLDAANYMYRRFNELGIPVSITRSTDETLSRDERLNRINNAFGNDAQVILLSNHINAGGGEGAEIVYALRNTDTLARNVLESIGQEGQITRKYYQRRLPEDPSKDYYYIMRETGNITPLLIEYGFIDNANDLRKLQNNLLDYVEAVVRAVANYTGYTYVAPDGTTPNTYTVLRGDTLYSIAQKYGITVDELKSYNNITGNTLQIGQVLQIPMKEIEEENNYINYTVKSGDSLYKIAREFDTTVKEIIDLNNLTTTLLTIGQILKIPSDIQSSDNIYYTVVSGDSLYSIARRYGVTVDDIISANNLTSTVLDIGDILLIPVSSSDNEDNQDNYINYTVVSGDSLYSIATRFNTTVNEIKSFNNLTSNTLQIGQTLRIPTGENYRTYTVTRGDSLYSIATRFNTTVDRIKTLNNLTSNTLQIGQILRIP